MLIIWETTLGVYMNSLYDLCNFSVNINYSKLKCTFKRIRSQSIESSINGTVKIVYSYRLNDTLQNKFKMNKRPVDGKLVLYNF